MPLAVENPIVLPEITYKEDAERCEGADIPRAYTELEKALECLESAKEALKHDCDICALCEAEDEIKKLIIKVEDVIELLERTWRARNGSFLCLQKEAV